MTVRSALAQFYPGYRLYRSVTDFRDRWRYHRIVKRYGLPVYDESEVERLRKELLAIELCRSFASAHSWLEMPTSLVAGAADHKLIYLLSRCLTEQRPRRILELGAGETTRLLHSYALKFPEVEIVTVEHDASWADRLRANMTAPNHQMLHRPLTTVRSARFGDHAWYEVEHDALGGPFDLVLVDGPVGTPSYSRIGFVDRHRELLAGEWMVLWDDVHRAGDLESMGAFLEDVRGGGLAQAPACVIATSVRSTGVMFTSQYGALRWYF